MTWKFKLSRRIAASHPSRARSPLFAGVLCASFLSACAGNDITGVIPDDSSPVPAAQIPGVLDLRLTTPSGNDGAIQFTVVGPAIDSVRAVGYTGFESSATDGVQMIITGAIRGGVVARVYVPDLSLAGQYRTALVAAAASRSYELQDLTGYRAELTR